MSDFGALIERARSLRHDDPETAKALLRQAADGAGGARMPRLEASARHELGSLMRRKLEDRAQALEELNRALELRIDLRDTQGQIETLLEIGIDAWQRSDLASALSPLHEAERLSKTSGIGSELSAIYETLCGVYGHAGRPDDALRYAELCVAVSSDPDKPADLVRALDALACAERDLGRYDDAVRRLQECLVHMRRIEDQRERTHVEGILHLDLARAFLRAGKWEEAEQAADRAITLGEALAPGVKGEGLFHKARVSRARGDGVDTEQTLQEAYRLLLLTGNKSVLMDVERELAMFYRSRGDDRSAFEYLERSASTQHAMHREAAIHQMAHEQARERLDSLLQKSAQLEAISKHKSEFLANMSHELRTPLNAVIGFSELLAERMFGELNERQADYVKDIHESGKHLLSLVNDILDLSKVEAGRMEIEAALFDLPSALSGTVTLVRERALRHGIALSLEVDPRLGQIRADERKLKQILLNLLSNAVKFTPDGGRIEVTARLDGRVAEIAVRDSGVGIAPEDQAAVFEEFRQVGRDAARKAEGTGLGLALTKRLVELHGGEIRLISAPGEGSTFAFTLPAD